MLFNRTEDDGFILLGFYEYPHLKFPLFLIFLVSYVFCVLENLTLIVIISLDSNLHNPMYFFLCNLSFLDISFTSIIFPKLLFTFFDLRRISYLQCMVQVYIFIALQSAEIFVLTVMSYDRYVAICNPFHYNQVLSRKNCILLVTLVWITSLLNPAPIVCTVSHLAFCKFHVIDHLFCDLVPLLELACGDTSKVESIIVIEGGILSVVAFVFTFISYMYIIRIISKIPSTRGKLKAFSTCSSHLTVIIMLYSILFSVYLQPPTETTNTKTISILNTAVIPMLNPLLYSLRNTEVKKAFHRCVRKFITSRAV